DSLDQEETLKAKKDLKQLTEKMKWLAGELQKTGLKDKAKELRKSLDLISNVTKIDDAPTVQEEKWIGLDNTVIAEIYDPQGNVMTLNSTYEKMREGKFKIKLFSDDVKKPGLYTIKTILTVDGQEYVTEKQFAWGLVSLNTHKSIYKPGENATFVIVVLDNEGHPVCDANIAMNVTSPVGYSTILATNNGITPNDECGLYDASYVTSQEGTYDVSITAITPSGITDFETSFVVAQNYDYDIMRTALSKIDPVNNPNNFNMTINVESFVGSGPITIRESVPSSFDLITDGTVQEINGTKIITWIKDLDLTQKTVVSYNYSVPLIYPMLYPLGKIEIERNGSVFTEARNWFVAVDPATFVDGTTSANFVSCPTKTTLATTTTNMAGTNIIIGSAQLRSTDSGNELINTYLNRSSTNLSQNALSIEVGIANTHNNLVLLGRDTSAPANSQYLVSGCQSASTTSGEAKIVAISGLNSTAFAAGSTTGSVTAATDRQITSLSTDFNQGNNIIVATIQLDNAATAQDIAAGGIEIVRGGTSLSSNEFAISLGTGQPTDIQSCYRNNSYRYGVNTYFICSKPSNCSYRRK
ncbi:MAG: hypothetical protein HZC29_00285, partial [Thaumarchaeota archaeon]|nr:hypothetical protein [Nitrososphaerota archaeon]